MQNPLSLALYVRISIARMRANITPLHKRHIDCALGANIERARLAYITSAYIKKNAIAAYASLLRCFCHNLCLYQKERTRKEDKIKYPVHVVFDTALRYSKNNAIAANASLLRCFRHNLCLYQKERTRKEDKIKYSVHVVFDTALRYSKNNAIAAYASLLRCFCHKFLLYQK